MFGNLKHWLYTGHWPKWYDTQHVRILGADHIRQCCSHCPEHEWCRPYKYRNKVYVR